MELRRGLIRRERLIARLAPAQTRAIVAADARYPSNRYLHQRPGRRHRRLRCFEDDGRRSPAGAKQMQLVTTHVDQPPWMRESPSLESRRDTLVGDADQQQNQECDAGSDKRAADRRSHGRGSGLRFGEAVFLDAGVELRTREPEQLRGARLVVPCLMECLDDQRTLDGVEVHSARGQRHAARLD
jgi:hypothetical protein